LHHFGVMNHASAWCLTRTELAGDKCGGTATQEVGRMCYTLCHSFDPSHAPSLCTYLYGQCASSALGLHYRLYNYSLAVPYANAVTVINVSISQFSY
jgi:hypothetical protein